MKINIMILNILTMVSLAATCAWAQAPEGRWDGTIKYGGLNIPFTLHFESNGNTLTGSFVNGDARVASTEGSFEAGAVRLIFGASGTRLDATLAGGELKGAYGKGGQEMHPFTAAQFCTCNSVGEAGPDISGNWEAPDASWRLTIRRKGDDTLATVSRPSGELGPIAGRFDGLIFMLHYFDGARAALLEIEPRKDDVLDLKFNEPGAGIKKHRAIKATTRN